MLEARSKYALAITADLRPPEHDGPSYQGDVWDIIDLQTWDVIFFVGPPCYQHLKGDKYCLAAKIADGRAYWGGAMVVKCITCPYAKMAIVEQPDTLVGDHLDVSRLPGVTVVEVRTTQYGCAKDKFMRFTLRNATIPAPRHATPPRVPRPYRPSAREYPSDDARDRARSSWADYGPMCESLALIRAVDPDGPPPLPYADVIEMYKESWARHYPVPPAWDNATGQPPTEEERAYQLVRGPGDGRRPGEARRSEARQAEPGNQRVAVPGAVALRRLVERRTAAGQQTTAAQDAAWRRLLTSSGTNATQAGIVPGRGGARAHDEARVMFAPPNATAYCDVDASPEGRIAEGFSPRCPGDAEQEYFGIRGSPLRSTRLLDQEAGHPPGGNSPPDLLHENSTTHEGRQSSRQVAVPPTTDGQQLAPCDLTLLAPRASKGDQFAERHCPSSVVLPGDGSPPAPQQSRCWNWHGSSEEQPRGMATGHPLSKSLRDLAETLAPDWAIVDCGGAGECGNNSLAYAGQVAGVTTLTGSQLRRQVCRHARVLVEASHVWQKGEGRDEALTTRQMLSNALLTWAPQEASGGADRWIELMECGAPNATWVDQAFLALAADYLAVQIKYYAVQASGDLASTGVIQPSEGILATTQLAVALEVGQHYCAVVRTGAEAAHPPELGARTEQGEAPSYTDPALVPTPSQIGQMCEESAALRDHLALATRSEEELEAVVEALAADAEVTPDTQTLEAMRQSRLALHTDALVRAGVLSHDEATGRLRRQPHADYVEHVYPSHPEEGHLGAQAPERPSARAPERSGSADAVEEPPLQDLAGSDFLPDIPSWDDAVALVEQLGTTEHSPETRDMLLRHQNERVLELCLAWAAANDDLILDEDDFRAAEQAGAATPTRGNGEAWDGHVADESQLAGSLGVWDDEPSPALALTTELAHRQEEDYCSPTWADLWPAHGQPEGYDSHEELEAFFSQAPTVPLSEGKDGDGASPHSSTYATPSTSMTPMITRPASPAPKPPTLTTGQSLNEDGRAQRALQAGVELASLLGPLLSDDEGPAPQDASQESTATVEADVGLDGELPAKAPTLEVLEGGEAPRSTTVVIPYALVDGGPVVFIPSAEEGLLGLHWPEEGNQSTAVVEVAEAATRRSLALRGAAVGFTAGTSPSGARVVVVATEEIPSDVALDVASRRRKAGAGVLALWCTVAAVMASRNTQSRTVGVAVAAASHFITHDGTTSAWLKGEQALRDATELRAGKAEYRAPTREILRSTGDITPRSLISHVQGSLRTLKDALLQVGQVEWADAIKPLRLGEIAEDLLDRTLAVDDGRLSGELFAEPLPVYETPWLPRAPPQEWNPTPECENYVAHTALDLVDWGAKMELRQWFVAARKDADCLERLGEACDRRHKPPTIAIGQEQFHPCSRGYVWDCRERPCRLLDYEADVSTDLNMDYLRTKLQGYPDQRLASNILQGIRLEADPELQLVLSPHLVSIGAGYDSVQDTVRELEGKDFYDFFDALPYMPIVLIGNGARIKKLGSKKYRRTSNFSGPHKRVTDKAGRVVVPINEASKCYTIPQWMAESRQATLRRWAKDKYAHVPPEDARGRGPSPRHKFPKERKPSLADVMRNVTILLYAAMMLGQPLFVWVEDAAFYFNQFGYAPEELWKSNLVISARPGDLTSGGAAFEPGQLIFVSEKRLGFGSFASSNIAQRFSNALVGWTMEEFDRLEEEARQAQPDEAWEDWIARREPLEAECRGRRPARAQEAPSDCKQTRLASLVMFTDDPAAVVVGVDRAVRMLEAWHRVTRSANVVMAPDKRQLGADVEWIGVLLLAAIGLIAVPKNKLLRARHAIGRTLEDKIDFGEYRALVGLLEHLRFITHLTADLTNVLYQPHGRGGESRDGPSAIVKPTGLMRKALQSWLSVVDTTAGAVVTIVFHADAHERLSQAAVIYAASSDAAGDGKGTPGFGGYMHGFYWRVAVPAATLSALHITAWETLAACVNILVAGRLTGEETLLALQVDALLTPYAIGNQKSTSVDVQHILQELLAMESYQAIASRLVIRHLSGDGNVPSDYVSRGLWPEFAELCAVLRVKPIHVRLATEELALVQAVVEHGARRRAPTTTPTSQVRPLLRAPRELTSLASAAAPPRNRTLSPGEDHRGKSRRNCVDGDGAAQAETQYRSACLLVIGDSQRLGAPAALLVKDRASGLYMVPGGLRDALDREGAETAYREFQEEVFGMTSAVAQMHARALVETHKASGALTGPYGRPHPHQAFLMAAREPKGRNAMDYDLPVDQAIAGLDIDELLYAFVPNRECTEARLVPIAHLHGTNTALWVDGEHIRLRDKLGYLRVGAAQVWASSGATPPLVQITGARHEGSASMQVEATWGSWDPKDNPAVSHGYPDRPSYEQARRGAKRPAPTRQLTAEEDYRGKSRRNCVDGDGATSKCPCPFRCNGDVYQDNEDGLCDHCHAVECGCVCNCRCRGVATHDYHHWYARRRRTVPRVLCQCYANECERWVPADPNGDQLCHGCGPLDCEHLCACQDCTCFGDARNLGPDRGSGLGPGPGSGPRSRREDEDAPTSNGKRSRGPKSEHTTTLAAQHQSLATVETNAAGSIVYVDLARANHPQEGRLDARLPGAEVLGACESDRSPLTGHTPDPRALGSREKGKEHAPLGGGSVNFTFPLRTRLQVDPESYPPAKGTLYLDGLRERLRAIQPRNTDLTRVRLINGSRALVEINDGAALNLFRSWIEAELETNDPTGRALAAMLGALTPPLLLLGAHFICPRATVYEPYIAPQKPHTDTGAYGEVAGVGLHIDGAPMRTLIDPTASMDPQGHSQGGGGFREANTSAFAFETGAVHAGPGVPHVEGPYPRFLTNRVFFLLCSAGLPAARIARHRADNNFRTTVPRYLVVAPTGHAMRTSNQTLAARAYDEERHRGASSSCNQPSGPRPRAPARRLGTDDDWGQGLDRRWTSKRDEPHLARAHPPSRRSKAAMALLLALTSGAPGRTDAHATCHRRPLAAHHGHAEPRSKEAPCWLADYAAAPNCQRPRGRKYEERTTRHSSFLKQEVIKYTSFVPLWASSRTTEDEGPSHTRYDRRHDTAPTADARFIPSWATCPTSAPYPANARVKRPRSWGEPTARGHNHQYLARGAPGGATQSEALAPGIHPYAAPAYGSSTLRTDQVDTAREFAKRLARDKSAGRIGAPLAQLEEMALAVAEARADGINPRTASKDAFALREFTAFSQVMNFDPNLQTSWTKQFPERESLKLASFLMWRAQRAVPRSRKGVAKPMSIYQNYLALRRVFRARDVELTNPGTVRDTLRGLIRRFIRRFGIDALRPKRVEPVTPDIIRGAIALARAGTTRIKGTWWKIGEWVTFIVTAWMVVNLSVGSRKGESTELPGDVDENDWFNRAALTWQIAGRTITDPTEGDLKRLTEGDLARLAPRGSKCDQWGTCHGTEPIILPYHDDDVNAARWLRDIELRWPAHGDQRRTLPLFPDKDGRPFRDATFAGLIMAVLRELLGDTRASLLSPHSWRVWLASSLRMCGATDARIQAMGRWLNPDSIKIYARMTVQEYGDWVDKLMAVKRIDTARTTSLPVMDVAEAIAAWGDELHVTENGAMAEWTEPETPAPDPPPAPPGTRITVYWTELDEWFSGTLTSSRLEDADGGGKQRSSRVVYDKTGLWTRAKDKDLVYWHNLSDELWKVMGADDRDATASTTTRIPTHPPVTPLKGRRRT